jgi:hypothetical protein
MSWLLLQINVSHFDVAWCHVLSRGKLAMNCVSDQYIQICLLAGINNILYNRRLPLEHVEWQCLWAKPRKTNLQKPTNSSVSIQSHIVGMIQLCVAIVLQIIANLAGIQEVDEPWNLTFLLDEQFPGLSHMVDYKQQSTSVYQSQMQYPDSYLTVEVTLMYCGRADTQWEWTGGCVFMSRIWLTGHYVNWLSIRPSSPRSWKPLDKFLYNLTGRFLGSIPEKVIF